LIPCAGSEQTRTAPSPPPEKAQSACSAVRAAHRLLRDDGSLSTSASSGFASVHQSAPVARPSGKQPFDTVQHHLGLVGLHKVRPLLAQLTGSMRCTLRGACEHNVYPGRTERAHCAKPKSFMVPGISMSLEMTSMWMSCFCNRSVLD
jgi:hypothetical protein